MPQEPDYAGWEESQRLKGRDIHREGEIRPSDIDGGVPLLPGCATTKRQWEEAMKSGPGRVMEMPEPLTISSTADGYVKGPDGWTKPLDMVMEEFEQEVTHLINRLSLENACNTPDYLLALVCRRALQGHIVATRERDRWYGIKPGVGWENPNAAYERGYREGTADGVESGREARRVAYGDKDFNPDEGVDSNA